MPGQIKYFPACQSMGSFCVMQLTLRDQHLDVYVEKVWTNNAARGRVPLGGRPSGMECGG